VKTCPANTFVASGTVCRDSVGECDIAETVLEFFSYCVVCKI
jgi:hypothetical protein